MTLNEHEKPIQSLTFADSFEYMVSATQEELVIWKLSCEEAQNLDDITDNEEDEEAPSRYSISAT